MFRWLICGVLVLPLCLVGCDQPVPPTAGPNLVPATPAAPAPGPAPTPSVTPPGPASITLEAARDARGAAAAKLTEILDTVKDDASAAAAAPLIPPAAQTHAAAVKQFNATMAALSLSGQEAQIQAFFESQADKPQPETALLERIEAVVNGPQGPALQPAINGMLDAWLQVSTTGERRGLTNLIEKKKLRR